MKTKEIIQKEIYEIKTTAQDMKEELNKDMENLRKKNQTKILEIKISLNQIKIIVESHSCRLDRVEDRISEPKDKIDIKEKTEESLDKRLKSCDSIKRPNL
jgi:chromosome segregation ATPase